MRRITKELIWNYRDCLIEEEKTPATLEKYLRDITAFTVWCGKKS